MANPKQLGNLRISALHNSTRVALVVHGVDESGNFVSPGAGSTQVSIKEILTSSGASVMDSTEGAIKVNVVAGAAGGSTAVTVRQSTYTDLNALSRLADRDASTAVAAVVNALQPASSAYGIVVRLPAPFADSTNDAIKVNVVAGAAGGSTTVTVRQSTAADLTAAVVQGSSVWQTQVSSLAGVVAVQQNSTVFAVQVDGRVRAQNSTVGDFLASVSPLAGSTWATRPLQSSAADLQMTATPVAGSTWNVRPLQSSQADLRVTVYQSTAADLNVTVAGYSTTINVSSLAGAVIVRSSAANALGTVYQSTASELQVTARVNTSSGGAVEGSTAAPAVGVIGLHMRQVFPTMQSTTIVITSTHSTAIYPIVSSVAGLRHKVYAYFVGSTHMNPSTLIFCSSISNSAFDHWAVNFGSGSSGVTGANLAMTPPGFLFGGVSQNALNIKIEGGSSVTATCVARVSLSWFSEA